MREMHQFYAVCPVGLEAVAADELAELAAHEIRPMHGGVEFAGSLELMFRVNLRARCLTRVLLRLASFKALSFPELYNKSRKSFWKRYLTPSSSFRVQAGCHASKLIHSGRVAQAVADALRDTTGAQNASQAEAAEQSIHVRFEQDVCTLSIDTSGDRLDRRGYRVQPGRAPIRETIAAGLLRWMQWGPDEPLMVPMCGSGTFAIEAAAMAVRSAPGLTHDFPFGGWPCLQQKRWLAARDKAAGMRRDLRTSILASDIDAATLDMARTNAEAASVHGIVFDVADFRHLLPTSGHGLIVLNPPYGDRLDAGAAQRLYGDIGRVLSLHYPAWRKLVITPDAECERQLGLPVQRRLPFVHGGLRVQALEL